MDEKRIIMNELKKMCHKLISEESIPVWNCYALIALILSISLFSFGVPLIFYITPLLFSWIVFAYTISRYEYLERLRLRECRERMIKQAQKNVEDISMRD